MEDISEELRRVVSHIREVAEPERIILFGSAARGDMGLENVWRSQTLTDS